jgi:hypothetical protein
MSIKTRLISLIFLLNIVFPLTFIQTAKGQITEKKLNKFYRNNSKIELDHLLAKAHNKACEEYSVIENDTLKAISDLFNAIFLKHSHDTLTTYFFLQANYPVIKIDKNDILFTNKFIVSTSNNKLKPIINDSQSIEAVLSFIGQNPYDMQIVKNTFKNRKHETKKIKKIIANYNNRTRFIEELLHLPATWGRLINSLVPFKINSLRFNKKLNEVEVDYSWSSSGATEIYKLTDKGWLRYKTLIEWIH